MMSFDPSNHSKERMHLKSLFSEIKTDRRQETITKVSKMLGITATVRVKARDETKPPAKSARSSK